MVTYSSNRYKYNYRKSHYELCFLTFCFPFMLYLPFFCLLSYFILYIWCISLHVFQISINCKFPSCILKTRQYINLKSLEIWKHSFCKKNSHAFISWRIWDKYDVRELTAGSSTHKEEKSKIFCMPTRRYSGHPYHTQDQNKEKGEKKGKQHLTFHLYLSMKWWYIQQTLKWKVVGAERVAQ